MEFARVGPPVMYAVRDMNISSGSEDIDAICGAAGCDDDSLVNRITAASLRPAETYVATPAASWIDDFTAWVSPELPSCCREYGSGAHSAAVLVTAQAQPKLF